VTDDFTRHAETALAEAKALDVMWDVNENVDDNVPLVALTSIAHSLAAIVAYLAETRNQQ